jgi:hypothetical protein
VRLLPAAPPFPPPQPAAGRKPPLLALDLAPNKEGTRFVLSTPPGAVVAKLLGLFDGALGRTQGLHTLEPAIMENLFWASVPVLSTVHAQARGATQRWHRRGEGPAHGRTVYECAGASGLTWRPSRSGGPTAWAPPAPTSRPSWPCAVQEPGVLKLRASLQATLEAALQPLEAYMAKFERCGSQGLAGWYTHSGREARWRRRAEACPQGLLGRVRVPLTRPCPPWPPLLRSYVPLLQLNVEAYVAGLEAKGQELTLAEVRGESRRRG